MAPELLKDTGKPSPAADVYSLGATLFECATGACCCSIVHDSHHCCTEFGPAAFRIRDSECIGGPWQANKLDMVVRVAGFLLHGDTCWQTRRLEQPFCAAGKRLPHTDAVRQHGHVLLPGRSAALQWVLQSMLHPDPATRPSAQELVDHVSLIDHLCFRHCLLPSETLPRACEPGCSLICLPHDKALSAACQIRWCAMQSSCRHSGE